MKSRQSIAIDNARAALIIGVIVYHTARVFDPFEFYVKSPVTFEGLTPMILFGALWGMPLFFLIAGYSIWHSLNSRGTGRFLRERVTRLFVPFVAGLVLLVPVQIFVQRQISGENISYLQMLERFLDVHFTLQFPIPVSGPWFELSHLWFLGYLFAFTIVLTPALIWLKRRPATPEVSPRHAVMIWALTIVLVVGAESRLGTEEAGGWNRWTFLVFLVFGILLAYLPSLGEMLARRSRLLVACAFASFAVLVIAGVSLQGSYGGALATSQELGPMAWRALKACSAVLFLMAIIGSLFGYEVERATSTGRLRAWGASTMAYVKQVSLPLYIVHQTIVVVIAYLILQWAVPAPVQWLALAALALSLSLMTVEIGRRTRSGRLMLGMKAAPRKPASTSPVLKPEAGSEARLASSS